ncbi:hypothetical protein ATCVTN60342_805R [Acanthocystis turfacea Chlorella virus TN603.4.2]|nr:hypothetical protein ATCVTN60342_805R [Acanthocystis turfacea Chlorella virus TN603.4.2]
MQLQKVMRIIRENWVFIAIVVVVVFALAMMMRKEKYIEGCSLCSPGDAGVLPGSVFTMSQIMNLDKELEGCRTCDTGDAGVLPGSVHTMQDIMSFDDDLEDFDEEIAGCSTCDAGDAGILVDTETTPETEMYNMPDEYYGSDVKVAETIKEVAANPSEIAAVVQDREEDAEPMYMTPLEYQNTVEQELEYMSPMQYQDNLAQSVYNMTQDLSAFTDTEDSDLMSIDPIDYALQSDAQLVNDFYGLDSEIDYKKRERIAAVKAMPIDFYMSDSSFTLL